MPRVSAIERQKKDVHAIFTQHHNLVVTKLVFEGVKMALDSLIYDGSESNLPSQSQSQSQSQTLMI